MIVVTQPDPPELPPVKRVIAAIALVLLIDCVMWWGMLQVACHGR